MTTTAISYWAIERFVPNRVSDGDAQLAGLIEDFRAHPACRFGDGEGEVLHGVWRDFAFEDNTRTLWMKAARLIVQFSKKIARYDVQF